MIVLKRNNLKTYFEHHDYRIECPYCGCNFIAQYKKNDYIYMKYVSDLSHREVIQDFEPASEKTQFGLFECPECCHQFISTLDIDDLASVLNMTKRPYLKYCILVNGILLSSIILMLIIGFIGALFWIVLALFVISITCTVISFKFFRSHIFGFCAIDENDLKRDDLYAKSYNLHHD